MPEVWSHGVVVVEVVVAGLFFGCVVLVLGSWFVVVSLDFWRWFLVTL